MKIREVTAARMFGLELTEQEFSTITAVLGNVTAPFCKDEADVSFSDVSTIYNAFADALGDDE